MAPRNCLSIKSQAVQFEMVDQAKFVGLRLRISHRNPIQCFPFSQSGVLRGDQALDDAELLDGLDFWLRATRKGRKGETARFSEAEAENPADPTKLTGTRAELRKYLPFFLWEGDHIKSCIVFVVPLLIFAPNV